MEDQKDISLQVQDLEVKYYTDDGVVNAVNGVNLILEKGKTVGLVGETGAGKTTTALAILQLIQSPPGKITKGAILFRGEDLLSKTSTQMEEIRGNQISIIFQDPMVSLNPVHTIGAQIAEVIAIHQHVSKEEAFEKAKNMLELVGIPGERAGEYPHQFSGGMKQRVIIAIALACNPTILIADEPTTALDVTIQAQVLELVKNLRDRIGTSVIMITHDLGIVADVCDSVGIMYAGRIVEYGTLEEIFNKTKHPYTEGLFNSLPRIGGQREPLKPIKGLMPDPTNLPEGCPFHPRCEYACPICSERKPVATRLSETHLVECLAYEEGTGITIDIQERER